MTARRSLALVGWVVLLCAGAAAESLDLALPDRGYYEPGEPFRFDVRGLPDEVAPRLALELDEVNVTRFVSREGDFAILQLPMPVEAGSHRLRVVDYRPDGTIEEIGTWVVEVRRAGRLSQATLEADLAGGVDYRVADHRLKGASGTPVQVPDRTLLQGEGTVRGRMAGDGWSADAYVPFLYRDDRFTQSGQPWDLGPFTVSYDDPRFSGVLGHSSPDHSSLIMEGFHRRGVQGTVRLDEVGSQVTAFSYRANAITGFQEGLGIRDRDDRVSGVIVSAQPWADEDRSLDLIGTYLRGRVSSLGAGDAGLADIESGTAWSLVADASFLRRHVRIRGEYARSRIDPYAGGPGRSQRDDAFSVMLMVHPLREINLWSHWVDWTVQVELEELGPRFDSPANFFPENDQRRERVASRLQIDGLSLIGSFERTRYNVENVESEPGFRQDTFNVMARYEPQRELPRWLGVPHVEVNYGRQRLKPISTPDPTELLLDDFFGGFVPIYADQLMRTASLQVGSYYDRFSWDLSHIVERSEDRTRFDPDTRLDGSAISLTFSPTHTTGLSLLVQRNRLRQEDFGYQTTSWSGSLSGWWVPWERWSLQLTGGLTRFRDSTSSVDDRVVILSPAVSWVAIESRPNRPGLTLTVDGTWQHRMDDVNRSLSTDVFQVFLKARLDLPIRYP